MISLEYPALMWLILLPLAMLLLKPYRSSTEALRVPWFLRLEKLFELTAQKGAIVRRKNIFLKLFNFILWCLLVVALAKPQMLEEPITKVMPTRDLLLLVDLSGSMQTEDFTRKNGKKADRLTAVKEVLADFLKRREGDRVGLIIFGNSAFVQIPFTQDLEACQILLEQTAVGMAGPKTAFGSAIGLGINLFRRSELEHKVIIALTDGNDTGSKVSPTKAAEIAHAEKIQIHVVGVGDPKATGEEKLDTETLEGVAAKTGGRYFHAQDRKQLEEIYAELDQIDSREVESSSYHPRKELYFWPLALFLVLVFLQQLIISIAKSIQGRNDRG